MRADDILIDFFEDVSVAPLSAAMHAQCFDKAWIESDFLSALRIPGTAFEILSIAGNPAAFALYRHIMDEAEILTLGTLPKFRRKGVAAQLLDQGFSHLKANEVKYLNLEVGSQNIPAQRLYKEKGFTETGRRQKYYNHNGSFEDAIIMKVRL